MRRAYPCPNQCGRRLAWRPHWFAGPGPEPTGAYVCEPCGSAWAPDQIEPPTPTEETARADP